MYALLYESPLLTSLQKMHKQLWYSPSVTEVATIYLYIRD